MLNKDLLKNDLYAAIMDAAKKNAKDGVSLETAIDNVAEAIASKVDAYVRSAMVSVNVLPGQIVVVGSPATQSNAAPIKLTGNLQ